MLVLERGPFIVNALGWKVLVWALGWVNQRAAAAGTRTAWPRPVIETEGALLVEGAVGKVIKCCGPDPQQEGREGRG